MKCNITSTLLAHNPGTPPHVHRPQGCGKIRREGLDSRTSDFCGLTASQAKLSKSFPALHGEPSSELGGPSDVVGWGPVCGSPQTRGFKSSPGTRERLVLSLRPHESTVPACFRTRSEAALAGVAPWTERRPADQRHEKA